MSFRLEYGIFENGNGSVVAVDIHIRYVWIAEEPHHINMDGSFNEAYGGRWYSRMLGDSLDIQMLYEAAFLIPT